MQRPDTPERNPYFATALRKMEQGDVMDAERHLMELLEHPGWKLVAGLVSARAESLAREVLTVEATNHIGYIVNAAEQRALRAVLDVPKDALATARWVDEKRRKLLEAQERQAVVPGGRHR